MRKKRSEKEKGEEGNILLLRGEKKIGINTEVKEKTSAKKDSNLSN